MYSHMSFGFDVRPFSFFYCTYKPRLSKRPSPSDLSTFSSQNCSLLINNCLVSERQLQISSFLVTSTDRSWFERINDGLNLSIVLHLFILSRSAHVCLLKPTLLWPFFSLFDFVYSRPNFDILNAFILCIKLSLTNCFFTNKVNLSTNLLTEISIERRFSYTFHHPKASATNSFRDILGIGIVRIYISPTCCIVLAYVLPVSK